MLMNSVNSIKVYITQTGKKMHSSQSCRSLSRSYGLRLVPIQFAYQMGLGPCSICFFYGDQLYLPNANQNHNQFQNYNQNIPRLPQSNPFLINQPNIREEDSKVEDSNMSTIANLSHVSNRSSSSNMSEVNNSQGNVILHDYSIHNNNNNSIDDDNNSVQSVSLCSKSSFLLKSSSFSLSIIPMSSSLKKQANNNELKVSRVVDDSIINLNKSKRVDENCNDNDNKEENDNRKNENKEVDKDSKSKNEIMNKSEIVIKYTNIDNNKKIFTIDRNFFSIENKERIDSQLNESQILNQIGKTYQIKDVDYYKDINEVNKSDLYSMPRPNQILFFKMIIKPKANNKKIKCRIGFDMISFNTDNNCIDETETIMKTYEITESSIVILYCNMIRAEFYLKYKTDLEKEWHYGLIKSISNDSNNKMIRPVISYKKDDYSNPSITAYKTILS